MKKITRSLPIFLIISFPLMGVDIDSSLPAFEKPALELSPSLCVIPEEQENCEIELTVTVSLEDGGGFCLVSSDVEINLCIAAGSRLYTHNIQLNPEKSIIIALTNLDGSVTWATEKLVVAEFSPSKTRRRRNLGWIL